MSYIIFVVQLLAAVPELIRAYREIKKLLDDDQKEIAHQAIEDAKVDFICSHDAKRFKEDLRLIRKEISSVTRA